MRLFNLKVRRKLPRRRKRQTEGSLTTIFFPWNMSLASAVKDFVEEDIVHLDVVVTTIIGAVVIMVVEEGTAAVARTDVGGVIGAALEALGDAGREVVLMDVIVIAIATIVGGLEATIGSHTAETAIVIVAIAPMIVDTIVSLEGLRIPCSILLSLKGSIVECVRYLHLIN
mmetsp:Transcript_1381/g.1859  ORF Transcript_1381/g.1859 Transcript_1381/m.1859 type:complete len:171 (+) Transcript_1381:1049-1561(+)